MKKGIWIKKYLREIEELLERYGIPLEHFIIVRNLPQWCQQKGIKAEISDSNIAIVTPPVRDTGERHIVFCEFAPYDIVEKSLKPAITIRNPEEDIEQLNTDRKFILHTLLHEMAHARGIEAEAEANSWAYKQLREIGLIGK